mmetsp:Transcript_25619/g.52159  ORF Transcript_25619/g.52159 Transcript_25619/m.52159 type:complete len:268 (+) Transcript_25619:229-1032(+)|eukprot:CAMPEP_0181323622 /NCGR_PEP_ID=MMETSP1101-20121128/19894_1 /TAXON_ID=46948 /ORGANISM="Rhodomonas abbreviata, Strain Caron Lab Isolate" /LENGTH=267 /DNA_ID=CAMNT_0023431683 /DNA_START=229 /DNA_END=1032 /DNA_ORIENTATION=-
MYVRFELRLPAKSELSKPGNLVFLIFAACHVFLFVLNLILNGASTFIGTWLVSATAMGLVWDNAILGAGRWLCPRAESDKTERELLSTLSQPRFILHAFLTPLLAVETAELGQRAGVSWIGNGTVITAFIVSGVVSAYGTWHHFMHPALEIKKPVPKQPVDAWAGHVLSMTTAGGRDAATLGLKIGPAVCLVIWTLIVGVSMMGSTQPTVARAGSWLKWTSVLELLSNGGPPWTMMFSGNCGEIFFLLGFIVAEWSLLTAEQQVAHS